MTLPKRCRVSVWERRQSGSSNSLAAGEINSAKSASVSRGLASASRTFAVVADEERFCKASNGSASNSATKLMELPYQKRCCEQAPREGVETARQNRGDEALITVAHSVSRIGH